jgi:threonine dehydrogenase-like Zn-dependent dehydrogenase
MIQGIKAAVTLAPGRIEIQEFPKPTLEPGDMLMRVLEAGICGTDKHTFRGETKQYVGTPAETDTPFPIIQGHEVVGIVEEINDKNSPRRDFNGEIIKPGDRLVLCPDVICGECYACHHTFAFPWCENMKGYGNAYSSDVAPHLMGAFAEYMYILPKAFVYKVPEELSSDLAVWSEIMAVSCNLDKAQETFILSQQGLNIDDTVLVQGTGPMGICHIIKARVMGAGKIIATDYSDFRLKKAQDFGADFTLNLKETTFEERAAAIRQLTQGRGVDVAVECAGTAEAVPEGLDLLRKGGTYIIAGNFVDTGDIAINPHRQLCAKNVRLLGITNHPFTGYTPSMNLMLRYADRFPFQSFITDRFRLEDAQKAVLRSMQPDTMKVVLIPGK